MTAPSDQLAPVGWVCTRNDRGTIVFEHEELPSTVRAVLESEDLWRIEMTEHAGEAESTRTVGYACTRDRALDALSTSMSAMNRVADRTGVVRAMMASTLALHDDAGVRDVAPEWRAADRPFRRQVSAEAPREPWRRGDDASGAVDADDPAADVDAAEAADRSDADGGDGADSDAAALDDGGDAAGADDGRPEPQESTDEDPTT